MEVKSFERLVELIANWNEIGQEISSIIGRPALPSHIGEYIASGIFDIKLEGSAATKGIDGIFAKGPLKGKKVNIKLYGRRENILDITLDSLADYYLVLTGPKREPTSSKGTSRPLTISNIYLFNMKELVVKLKRREIKIGTATSIANSYWDEAEIYPRPLNKEIQLTRNQIRMIKLFN